MKLRFLPVAVVAITFGVAEPAAARTLELAPASPWNLHYDADSCVLRRAFGEGEQQTQLEMRRFQPGISLQTTVVTKAARTTKRNYRYRFGDEAEWKEEEYPLYGHFADGFKGVIFLHSLLEIPLDEDSEPEEWIRFSIENDVLAMEAEAGAKLRSFTIARAFSDELILKTGPLKEPLLGLNQCIDELVTHWGIDVEAHKTRSRSAVPVNLKKAGRMIDYPPKMLRQSLPGLVNIRLDIDETGRVTQCHIQMPLSDPEFEETSCADIQHALDFDPALDKDSKPMKSYYVTAVRFQIGSAR
jgi:hypothetical protein